MKYPFLCLFLSSLLFGSCHSESSTKPNEENTEEKQYKRFSGTYSKAFNDLPDLHISAAEENGVGPLETRSDTVKYEEQLVRIPEELAIYKTDKLTHSMPFLVPKASQLLVDICLNFRDSLISKNMPAYKPIITSITRTNEDVKKLSRRNGNASDNSVHRYGTTFDISWVRYIKINELDDRTLDDGKLKKVLAEVLFDLRERDRCYIKHERKQACFHITVR